MATNPPPEEEEKKKPVSFNQISDSTRRKRTVFTKEQIHILKTYFQKNQYPGIEEREQISSEINIPEPRIHVWFQNKRARQSIQAKKWASEFSNNLKGMYMGHVSPGSAQKENFSEQEFASCANKSGQEYSTRSGVSFERRNAALRTKADYLYGSGSSLNYPFLPSQTMRPQAELQFPVLPRQMSQESSSQRVPSWVLPGFQGPESYDIQNYGRVKQPMYIQNQDLREERLYSNDHLLPLPYSKEPPHHFQQPHPQQNYPQDTQFHQVSPQQPHPQKQHLLQSYPYQSHHYQLFPQQPHSQQTYPIQPSVQKSEVTQDPSFQKQPLTSSQHQSQEFDEQTLPSPLVSGEEKSYPRFQAELDPTDVSERTVGVESMLPHPDGPPSKCSPKAPMKPRDI